MAMTAAQELALKTKHEGRLKRKVIGVAVALAKRLRDELKKGTTPDLRGVGAEVMRPILRDHYDQVARDFDHILSDQMPDDVQTTELERASIRSELDGLFDAQTIVASGLVMETTQKNVVRSVTRANRLIRESDELTVEDMPTLAANLFLVKQRGRSTILGRCATQWASETSKSVEASVLLQQVVATLKLDVQAWKSWRSRADSRVRTLDEGDFDHLSVDGQRVPSDDTFTVSGDELLYPGDQSHGARMGNVIGCRCSAVYDVETIIDLRRLIIEELLEDEPNPFPLTESDVVVGVGFDGAPG